MGEELLTQSPSDSPLGGGVGGVALYNVPKVGTWVLRVSRNPVHPDQLNGTK